MEKANTGEKAYFLIPSVYCLKSFDFCCPFSFPSTSGCYLLTDGQPAAAAGLCLQWGS